MARRINYKGICKALGLRAAGTRSGKLRYEGEGRHVYEDELRGEGQYDGRGVGEKYLEVERLRRRDPDAAIEAAAALRPISLSYFVEVVQTAINRKLRNRETADALEVARSHRRILPSEYFSDVVQKHVVNSLGKRQEEEAMTVADEFFGILPENLLQTTTRAYFAKMKRRGNPEAAFEHVWNFLEDDEFVELGRDATKYHGKRRGDWVRAKQVAERGNSYGVTLFNRDELRGLIERECFDRKVHERMSPEERASIMQLAEDLGFPQARKDQLAALMHETDFLANRGIAD